MDIASHPLIESGQALLASALDTPASTLGMIAVFVGLALLFGPMTRRRGPRRGDSADAAAVAAFQMRPVLNASERRLHRDIERLLPQHFHPRARLLSQVSIAEFVYAPDKEDFRTIAASRVDMLIVDPGFQPLCAIEYQGAGHYGADPQARARTRTRDWAKRKALRIAGVPLVEIPAEYDAALLADRLGDVTGRRPAPPPQRAHRADLQAGL